MPKVRWVVWYKFCSKFHALYSSAKILNIGQDLTKLQSLKMGTFFETQCSYTYLLTYLLNVSCSIR